MRKIILLISALISFSCFAQQKYVEITPTSGGATTITSTDYNSFYLLSGTPSLGTGFHTITYSGTAVKGKVITFYSKMVATGSTGGVIVFGTDTLTIDDLNSQCMVTLLCTATNTWQMRIAKNFSYQNIITARNLPDHIIDSTKILARSVKNGDLAGMTRGTIKVGNSSGEPSDLSAKSSGYILVGDGNDLKSVATSGDVTIAASGATTIGATKVDSSMIKSGAITFGKLQNITEGNIIIGNSTNRPALRDVKTNNSILIGNGTTALSTVLTGDVTINSGVTAISPEVIVVNDLRDTLRRETLVIPVYFDSLYVPDTILVGNQYNCKIISAKYSTIKTIQSGGLGLECAAVNPTLQIFTDYNTGIDYCYNPTINSAKFVLGSTAGANITTKNICTKTLPIKIYTNRAAGCRGNYGGGAVLLTLIIERIY